ncbi:hypothetical protein B0J14DRAFT_569664 [Halenospora varia]|nr:hypothetical protein B0J14DRAFT_569664 [Halenospora varia]
MLLWESAVSSDDSSAIDDSPFLEDISDTSQATESVSRDTLSSTTGTKIRTTIRQTTTAVQSLTANSLSVFDNFKPERINTMSDLTSGQKSTLAAIVSLSAVPRIGLLISFGILLYLYIRIQYYSSSQRQQYQTTTVSFTPRTDVRTLFPEQLQSPTRRGEYARVMARPEGWKRMNFGAGMGYVWVEEKEREKEGRVGERMMEGLVKGAGYAGVSGCSGTYWGKANYSRI